MTYASRTELINRYGSAEITQRESVLGVDAVDRALADADAEIDSYCAALYTVPLAPVPPGIAKLACGIARYNLLGDAATERARNDYADARAYLRDVQAGRALLESAAPLAGSEPASSVEITGRERIFNGGLL